MSKMIFCLVFLGIISFSLAANVQLTMLNDYPNAKCLDGTQAGYYAQPASDPLNKSKFIIYLNGGGECDNESACKSQLSNALGSSKYFSSQTDANYWYLASDSCSDNPQFCSWNHIFDPYCTQDLHSGQIQTASNETWGLYFSGHNIIESILNELDKPPFYLNNATDIILFGVSAGGIGVWMNVDYLANRYPNAHVTAVTMAGHYFYATYYNGPNATAPGSMADFRETAFPNTYNLYNAFVDESCKASQETRGVSPGFCMLSNNSYPFIESDSFVIQALTDNVVLTGHDCLPDDFKYEQPEQEFMEDWYSNMTVALKPLMSIPDSNDQKGTPRNGVFAAACYTHCAFSASNPIIQGYNYIQAFENFYFNYTNPSEYKLADNCGMMCNPTCV